jgi:hypothetical protein
MSRSTGRFEAGGLNTGAASLQATVCLGMSLMLDHDACRRLVISHRSPTRFGILLPLLHRTGTVHFRSHSSRIMDGLSIAAWLPLVLWEFRPVLACGRLE